MRLEYARRSAKVGLGSWSLRRTWDVAAWSGKAAEALSILNHRYERNGPSCTASAEACEKAVSWGWEKIYYFRDGYPGWKAAVYSLE